MKTRVLVGVSACCVAALSIILVTWMGADTEAIAAPEATSYIVIGGHYYDHPEGGYTAGTAYDIFNVNPTHTLVLGDIHLSQPGGTRHVWSGLAGTPIPPFGTATFFIGETGVPKATARGAWVLGITWDGQPGLEVVGSINYWDLNTGLLGATRTITPF